MGGGDWLNDRLGYRDWIRKSCGRPLPDGASWIRSLVFALILLFVFEGLTGFLLSLSYSPSTETAHASVEYTMNETLIGGFVRNLHFHAASLILVVITLIGLCCFYQGAYKGGNEASWILGVILLNLVFAYTISGFLLPWDQNAFWGTKVRTSIMGSTPLVGPMVQKVVQGGTDLGNLTLTRFYAGHFFLIPLVTVGVYFVYRGIKKHIWKRKMVGVESPETLPTYWPHQAARDVTMGCLVLAVLFGMSFAVPIELGPKADPLLNYPARPEWFFRWLYQLLKYFQGSAQIIGTIVIPGLMGVILILIPFLDRSEKPGFGQKKLLLTFLLAIALFCTGLTSIAYYHDLETGHYEEVELWQAKADPEFDVDTFYKSECFECHGSTGSGLLEATPDFGDPDFWSGSRADVYLIKAILEGIPNETLPEDERMPGYQDKINADQALALIEFKLKKFPEEE
ncbi:MAG: cytochrome b N-terminal domain-containing protein [Candidatus Omnitrophica bacterium]|nr:cytochrome b N-terminal domain-containing protein [Candidatus Omnitrophota bacterium]